MLKILRSYSRHTLALFIVLNLADFCTTASIISMGGKEVMPVAKGFIDSYGLVGLFFHKFIIASAVAYLCRGFTKRFWALLNNLFSVIVAWNTLQLCIFVYDITKGIPL